MTHGHRHWSDWVYALCEWVAHAADAMRVHPRGWQGQQPVLVEWRTLEVRAKADRDLGERRSRVDRAHGSEAMLIVFFVKHHTMWPPMRFMHTFEVGKERGGRYGV